MIGQLFMRMARQMVRQAVSGLTQQLNSVRDGAFDPMRAMVQQVTGGIWKGNGANAFVEEVSSLMIPGVGRVMEKITTTTNNLNRAVDVVDEADKKVQGMVNGLGDIFGRIYL